MHINIEVIMYVCMYVLYVCMYQVTEHVASASRTLFARSDLVPIDSPVINPAKEVYVCAGTTNTSFKEFAAAFICFWRQFCDWMIALHTMLVHT